MTFRPTPTPQPASFDWGKWNAEMDQRFDALALADARCREAVGDFMAASAELRAAINGLCQLPEIANAETNLCPA